MQKIFLQPSVVVLSGVPLTGKTYLSEKLKEVFEVHAVDVDMVRYELGEIGVENDNVNALGSDSERIIMSRAYTEMFRRVEDLIARGKAVVIAGTFSRPEAKQLLQSSMDKPIMRNAPFKIFRLTVSDEEAERRILKRREEGSFSNIDTKEKFIWAKGFFSPIDFAPVIELDSSDPEHIKKVFENLKDLEIK